MSSQNKAKDIKSFLLRAALSIGLLVFIFSKIDFAKTWEVLKNANMNYLALAAFVFFAVNFVILYRWFILIRGLKLDITPGMATRYFFAGLFGNLFLPSAIGGDIIKIYGLCREGVEKPKVFASVLLDRLSGFFGMVLVAVTGFIIGHKYVGDNSLILPIVVMGAGSLTIALVLFNESLYSLCCRIFDKFPKLKNGLMKMHYDVVLLKGRYGIIIKALVLSCISQVVLALIYYLTAKGLNQDIDLIYFLIFIPMICVASTFPSIGGLGVREAGAVYLFGRIGIDSGIAASLSLINFLFMVLVGLFGGIFYVSTLSSRRVQHHSQGSGTDAQGS